MQEGALPLKYLGISLISTRLRISDCQGVIDSMKKKVQGWSSKSLSYGGRSQLVKSVLMSLQNYCSIFMLPKKIIKVLEQIMSRFLWSGSDKSSGIKVTREETCKPLNEGGLGLNQLKIWNKALMLRHIWDIFCRKYSLWIAWVHLIKLNQRSFW